MNKKLIFIVLAAFVLAILLTLLSPAARFGSGTTTLSTAAFNSTSTPVAFVAGQSLTGLGANVNNYLESLIQNSSNGNNASSDFVATADNGTATTNYVNFGINGSGYSQSAFSLTGPDDGYFYVNGGNLAMTTASGSSILFATSGTTALDEKARITPAGLFAMGTSTQLTADLTVHHYLGNVSSTISLGTSADANYRGNLCFWNGVNYTKMFFIGNTITPSYVTSTSCP